MKQLYLLMLLLSTTFLAQSQILQQSIGGAHTTSVFNSVKYDPNDSGTINAGYIIDSTEGTGKDSYIVKLDKNKNIVWQKVFRNGGDDYINKVIVCKNGDYIAVGGLSQQYPTTRGFICRINSSNAMLYGLLLQTTHQTVRCVMM